MSARVARAGLLALAASLPFEAPTPMGLGPIVVTTTEAALYAALAAWVLSAPRRGRGWGPLHAAACAWMLALLLSAVLARTEPGAALKFALRGLAACGAFFVAADLAAAPSVRARVAGALVAGAVVAALLAVGEPVSPGLAAWLLWSKPATFRSGDAIRASGPLPYPNVAALYLEGILPLAVAFAARAAPPLARRLRLAPPLLLAAAVVATGSRAGVAVSGALLLGLIACDARGRLGLRAPAAASVAALALLMGAVAVTRPAAAVRLGLEADRPWYRADYAPAVTTLALRAGEATGVRVRACNRGALEWTAAGPGAMRVHADWREAGGRLVAQGEQVALPRDVVRGACVSVEVPVRAPERPGRYRLGWGLGRAGLAWADAVAAPGEVAVQVEPRGTGAPDAPEAAGHGGGLYPVQRQLTRLVLWHAAFELWRERPLTGVGPDNFRRLYAGRLGPLPIDDRVRANNLYLLTLAELGLVGLLALGLAVGGLARHANSLGTLDAPEPRRAALAAAAGLAGMMLHGAVDDVFHANATAIQFWLLAGLLAAARARG